MGPGDTGVVELAGEHRLEIVTTAGGNELRLSSRNGSTALTVEVSPHGIRLRLDGPSLAIATTRDLSISAEHLVLEGRAGLAVRSAGDAELAVGGDLQVRAQQQVFRAERGSVDVKASDDVKMSGERVLVNCDETVDAHRHRPG